MITMIEGKAGSGKSYLAVEKMIAYWIRGGVVCTNIHIYWGKIKEYCKIEHGVVLDDKQYIEIKLEDVLNFVELTPRGTDKMPVLVVIDEIHLWFNARDWSKMCRKTMEFLTLHRHESTDIIFLSQSGNNVDKQFRSLMNERYQCRNLALENMPKLGFKSPIPLLVVGQVSHDGQQTFDYFPKVRKLDMDICKLYHSKTECRKFGRMDAPQINIEKVGKDMKFVPTALTSMVCAMGVNMLMMKETKMGEGMKMSAINTAVKPEAVQLVQSDVEIRPHIEYTVSSNVVSDVGGLGRVSGRMKYGSQVFWQTDTGILIHHGMKLPGGWVVQSVSWDSMRLYRKGKLVQVNYEI